MTKEILGSMWLQGTQAQGTELPRYRSVHFPRALILTLVLYPPTGWVESFWYHALYFKVSSARLETFCCCIKMRTFPGLQSVNKHEGSVPENFDELQVLAPLHWAEYHSACALLHWPATTLHGFHSEHNFEQLLDGVTAYSAYIECCLYNVVLYLQYKQCQVKHVTKSREEKFPWHVVEYQW